MKQSWVGGASVIRKKTLTRRLLWHPLRRLCSTSGKPGSGSPHPRSIDIIRDVYCRAAARYDRRSARKGWRQICGAKLAVGFSVLKKDKLRARSRAPEKVTTSGHYNENELQNWLRWLESPQSQVPSGKKMKQQMETMSPVSRSSLRCCRTKGQRQNGAELAADADSKENEPREADRLLLKSRRDLRIELEPAAGTRGRKEIEACSGCHQSPEVDLLCQNPGRIWANFKGSRPPLKIQSTRLKIARLLPCFQSPAQRNPSYSLCRVSEPQNVPPTQKERERLRYGNVYAANAASPTDIWLSLSGTQGWTSGKWGGMCTWGGRMLLAGIGVIWRCASDLFFPLWVLAFIALFPSRAFWRRVSGSLGFLVETSCQTDLSFTLSSPRFHSAPRTVLYLPFATTSLPVFDVVHGQQLAPPRTLYQTWIHTANRQLTSRQNAMSNKTTYCARQAPIAYFDTVTRATGRLPSKRRSTTTHAGVKPIWFRRRGRCTTSSHVNRQNVGEVGEAGQDAKEAVYARARGVAREACAISSITVSVGQQRPGKATEGEEQFSSMCLTDTREWTAAEGRKDNETVRERSGKGANTKTEGGDRSLVLRMRMGKSGRRRFELNRRLAGGQKTPLRYGDVVVLRPNFGVVAKGRALRLKYSAEGRDRRGSSAVTSYDEDERVERAAGVARKEKRKAGRRSKSSGNAATIGARRTGLIVGGAIYTAPIARERRVDGLGKGKDSTWMGTVNGQRGSEHGMRYTYRRRETSWSFFPVGQTQKGRGNGLNAPATEESILVATSGSRSSERTAFRRRGLDGNDGGRTTKTGARNTTTETRHEGACARGNVILRWTSRRCGRVFGGRNQTLKLEVREGLERR
ncbi:hypothetical protein C8F04DRAFT_1186767 [Mycena alexandri]|uniref:Uncharacterized protein n=1 Tax=Mycena alexandri TaxID=1745969 RepID=A0AAD6SMZ7_9AGAR|nr:hypothetical protein C8F04DRAFT_1186767 [Mycena alexandri]